MRRASFNPIVFVLFIGLTIFSLGILSGPRRFPRPVHHYNGITILGNTEISEPWRMETARRFPNALIYASHGTNCGGKWICQNPEKPDSIADAFYVHDLALSLRQQYPDRVIVLVICNPGHLHVNVPGVFYANDDVLITPDAQNPSCFLIHTVYPTCVGNIFEFQEDK